MYPSFENAAVLHDDSQAIKKVVLCIILFELCSNANLQKASQLICKGSTRFSVTQTGALLTLKAPIRNCSSRSFEICLNYFSEKKIGLTFTVNRLPSTRNKKNLFFFFFFFFFF